jgi:hypothetical protein
MNLAGAQLEAALIQGVNTGKGFLDPFHGD